MEALFHRFETNECPAPLWVERRLAEQVVLRRLHDQASAGDAGPSERYHQMSDDFYGLIPRERDAAFGRLHAQMFREQGFVAVFGRLLEDFPTVAAATTALYVAQAQSVADESVDLDHAAAGAGNRRDVGMRVQPARFVDEGRLLRHLRHEWTHLSDLLDPYFDYETHYHLSGLSPMEENLVRDRYRTVWCATIDARLDGRGWQPVLDREGHSRVFARLFRSVAAEERAAAFRRLWECGSIPHPVLAAISRSRTRLLRFAQGDSFADISSDADTEKAPLGPSPGARCPLCRFPTFRWISPAVEDAGAAEPDSVFARVRAAFPEWRPEYGICDRCYERYELELVGA
jgi:hypothetical protein